MASKASKLLTPKTENGKSHRDTLFHQGNAREGSLASTGSLQTAEQDWRAIDAAGVRMANVKKWQ